MPVDLWSVNLCLSFFGRSVSDEAPIVFPHVAVFIHCLRTHLILQEPFDLNVNRTGTDTPKATHLDKKMLEGILAK